MFSYATRELARDYSPLEAKIYQIINDSYFVAELREKKEFFNSEVSGNYVSYQLRHADTTLPAVLTLLGSKRHLPWYRNTTAETVGKTISLNPKFMNRHPADQANTLVHEWLHTCGYSHIWNNPRRYPQILDSVPYFVGNLVEKHYRRIFG